MPYRAAETKDLADLSPSRREPQAASGQVSPRAPVHQGHDRIHRPARTVCVPLDCRVLRTAWDKLRISITEEEKVAAPKIAELASCLAMQADSRRILAPHLLPIPTVRPHFLIRRDLGVIPFRAAIPWALTGRPIKQFADSVVDASRSGRKRTFRRNCQGGLLPRFPTKVSYVTAIELVIDGGMNPKSDELARGRFDAISSTQAVPDDAASRRYHGKPRLFRIGVPRSYQRAVLVEGDRIERPRGKSSSVWVMPTIDDELEAGDVATFVGSEEGDPLAVRRKSSCGPADLSTTLSANCLIGSSVMPRDWRPGKGNHAGRCRMRKNASGTVGNWQKSAELRCAGIVHREDTGQLSNSLCSDLFLPQFMEIPQLVPSCFARPAVERGHKQSSQACGFCHGP